jgi:hypothetical protein
MKIVAAIAIFTLLWAMPAKAAGGMEITAMRPYSSMVAHSGPILTFSVFTPKLTPLPGFDEYGGVWLLPLSTPAESHRNGIQEFAGAYAGHVFLPWGGWIRPGFHFGWVWQESLMHATGGEFSRESGLAFYYGAKLQFSCLTFNISNKGIGGGINFSL